MYRLTSKDHLREFERILQHTEQVVSVRGILQIFWGLIIAKCLLLEWLAQWYAVPIRTLPFVWLPSILFGLLCMFFFMHHSFKRVVRVALNDHLTGGVWASCTIAAALVSFLWLQFTPATPYLLPAFFSLLAGVGYFIQSIIADHFLHKLQAIGWWILCVVLFSHSSEISLLLLSAGILLLLVVPASVLYLRDRRRDASAPRSPAARQK